MNAQTSAAADAENSSATSIQAITVATYLIASCARSTGARGQFGIFNAAQVPLVTQKDRHAV